jgi:hypothetical protein
VQLIGIASALLFEKREDDPYSTFREALHAVGVADDRLVRLAEARGREGVSGVLCVVARYHEHEPSPGPGDRLDTAVA